MELIETCFLATVIILYIPWVGVPSISPLMMVSKLWPMENRPAVQCISDNAVREFWNPCRNYENVGLMMWATTQDT